MTELDLITRATKEQDSSAINQLVDLHTGIYVNMVRRYKCYPDFRNKIEARDLLEDKAYHIYQFALKYDSTRGMTFGSYVGDCTRHLCQSVIHRKPLNTEFSEDIAPSNDTAVMDTVERDSSIEVILAQVKGSDSSTFRQIFKLRYCGQKPQSWRTIARAVGLSHEGCRKVYEKHIGAIKEHLKT